MCVDCVQQCLANVLAQGAVFFGVKDFQILFRTMIIVLNLEQLFLSCFISFGALDQAMAEEKKLRWGERRCRVGRVTRVMALLACHLDKKGSVLLLCTFASVVIQASI